MRKINYFALLILIVSFQLIGFAATPVHVTLSNGANCVLSGNVYMVVSGNLNNTGVTSKFTGLGTSTAKFINTAGQQLIGGTGTTQFQNAEFNNPSNFKLQGHVGANATVTLTAGTVDVDNYNFTMGTAANFSGTFGTTAMVIADNTNGKTGQVMKMFNSGANNVFLYPVGDATATIDYSPVTLTFSANSAVRTIGLNVADNQHPNDFSTTNYLSRYWKFTDNVCSGNYTYNATFSYSANSPSDLVGNYNVIDIYWWNSSWNKINTDRSIGAPTYKVTGVNETSGNLCSTQYTGRTCPLAVIVNSPSDQPVCVGDPVTFTVNATGSELSYQWKKGANNINGATNSTYAITSAKLGDYDIYTCSLSNACGSIDIPTFTLTVNSPPTSNIVFTNQNKICDAPAITLTSSPGGSAPFSFQWYQSGNPISNATKNSYTIGNNYLVETDSGLYSVKITNMCNTITPKVVQLYVKCSRFKFYVSGYVKYENKDSTAMSSKTPNSITNVSLYTMGDTLLETTQTDDYGFYVFNNVVNAEYKLIGSTVKKWGGSNPVDALLVNRYYIGFPTIPGPPSLKKLAADVNLDTKINPTDALMINRRYIGLLPQFIDKDKVVVPDWIFSKPTITVEASDITQKIVAICTGDVNGSYAPPLFPAKIIYSPVNIAGLLNINPGKQFDLPVYINDISEIGALGLKLKNQNSNLKILGVNSDAKDLIYNITDDGINIAWSADNQGLNITPDKPVLTLKAVYNGNQNPEGLQLSPESVIADINVNAISTDDIIMPKLVLGNSTYSADFNLYNHPNPFNNITNIDYVIPEDANVKLIVYNVLGEEISTLTNSFQKAGTYTLQFNGSNLKQGVYYCRIDASNSSSTFTKTNIMMIAR